jgi:predicted metal-dependent phosphoesterase TrpH
MIDLHSHSTFSDGSLTPRQLAKRGHDVGLTALALTDHDSTAGLDEFLQACGEFGIVGVPGVEISVDVPSGTMHMLGYFIGLKHKGLESMLARIRGGRDERNAEILKKLNDIGFKLSMDEVDAFAVEDVVGRPHFALAMVKKGYVPSKEAAFDKYLGKGKPGYVDRLRLSPEESMSAIGAAGGVPVLAHPFTLELGKKALRDCVRVLVEKGLKGLEVYYSEHSADQVSQYETLAREFNIVATGGTDFHGQLNPQVELGSGFGNLVVDDNILEELRNARDGAKATR